MGKDGRETVSQISKISNSGQIAGIGKSGASMDRVVERRMTLQRKLAIGAGGIGVLLFAWWVLSTIAGGRSLSVNSQRIVVSDVTVGTFEDFVPLRGRLVPKSTVYLDAIEGSRAQRYLVADAVIV